MKSCAWTLEALIHTQWYVHWLFLSLPCGKRLHNHGKSQFWKGKSTISMAIFNSFFGHYQRVYEASKHLGGPGTVFGRSWEAVQSCGWLVLKFHDTWGEAKYQLSTAGIVMETHRDPKRPMESQKELLDSSDISECWKIWKDPATKKTRFTAWISSDGASLPCNHCSDEMFFSHCFGFFRYFHIEDLKKHLTTRQLLRKSIACLRLHWSQACAATVARWLTGGR